MQGKSDYVNKLVFIEEEKSERLANYWRLGMSLLFFAVSKGVSPEIPPFSQNVLWLGSGTYFMFSIYMYFHLRAGRYKPWLKYLSVFVDIFLLTIVMWAFGTFRTFKTEAFLLYYVWIALATMRLSVQLTVFAGILSLVGYSILVITALVMGTIEPGTITESFISPKVSIQNQVLRILYMSIVIFALTYGARAYRKLASRAYEHEMEAEGQRMRAQRLESIGFLAGGIAHDFNNALAIISNNIHIAKILNKDNAKSVIRLEAAESAAMKATNLTRQLLTFSKGGAPVMKVMRVDNLIQEAARLSMTGSSLKCQIADMPQNLRLIMADEGQLNQVLNNLIINAIQASKADSTVTIEVCNHDIAEGAKPDLPAGQYVRIRVIDEGEGISEENITKIFDPYFTTKETGTGLGLATAYSIIRKHEGTIEVKSSPGKGAAFSIYLPASQESFIEEPPSGNAADHQRLNILVMDDEDEFLKSTGETLIMEGHKVAFASDGIEALALYGKLMSSETPFDVVLMDLTIPGGMGGAETIKKLVALDPGVKAIVSSGYSNDPVMSDYQRYGFKGILTKPFTFEQLNDELSRVVSGD